MNNNNQKKREGGINDFVSLYRHTLEKELLIRVWISTEAAYLYVALLLSEKAWIQFFLHFVSSPDNMRNISSLVCNNAC